MAQTRRQIQAMLQEAGLHPRHRLGQNFMIDGNLLRIMADAARVRPGDSILEVGAGTGSLTEELLSRGARVLAVEIDRRLGAILRRRLDDRPGFALVEADVLKGKHRLNDQILQLMCHGGVEMAQWKLVANLPYQIASPLIVELLLAGVGLLVFTVQKEVADRLCAEAGTRPFGSLSVIVQLLGHVELIRTIRPEVFWPKPGVHSSLVRIVRDDRLGMAGRQFAGFVQKLFAARRKMLRRALLQVGPWAEKALENTGIDGRRRPEELTPEEFLRLYRELPRPEVSAATDV